MQLILTFVLAAQLAAAPHPPHGPLCAEARAWADSHREAATFFAASSQGETYEPSAATWRRYESFKAFRESDVPGSIFYSAELWRAPGDVLVVSTTESSFSGDWSLYTTYCFDSAGRLLSLQSELRMLPSHAITRQHLLFDVSGNRVRTNISYNDLSSGAALRGRGLQEARAYQVPLRIYSRVKELPFASLLPVAPSHSQ